MAIDLYLTKSSFIAGLSCPKLLWLKWHQKLPYEDAPPGSPQAVGTIIGAKAHMLFPGGVLVDEEPWEHDQALERTRALVADDKTPAIFEAALEHNGVRIRVDVLERDGDRWHVHEVKSSTRVKDEHIPDLAVQVHVLLGSGVDVASAGIMHVNGDYVRGEDGINWNGYFSRSDLTDVVQGVIDEVPDIIENLYDVLAKKAAPEREVTSGCKACDYWDHCTADKPEHWVLRFPNLSAKKREDLSALDIEDIHDVPDDFPLTATQERMRQAVISGETYVSPDLWKTLREFGPPAAYLDFETMAPGIPLYPGTRPYQQLPVQWSLHRLDGSGNLSHDEFLAVGDVEPSREFAESLIADLMGSDEPILVYSSFERTTINRLIEAFPDLKEHLFAIVDRLKDLLPVMRGHVYHRDFNGSFSIKYVAPALAPHVDYGELDHVADGLAASAAFERIAAATLGEGESAAELRAALLRYCELDTFAMVEVHRALMGFVTAQGAA